MSSFWGTVQYFNDYYIENENGSWCEPLGYGDVRNFFITADGVLFCITNFYNGQWASNLEESEQPCNVSNTFPCSYGKTWSNLFIDVNGQRNPNKATISSAQPRDQYSAFIYNTKVVPYGVGAEIMYEKK